MIGNMEKRGSLISGLAILEAFLNSSGELSLSELAKATGLTMSTVHRIISILMKKDYVQQPHKRGKYSLTLKFVQFANTVNTRIRIREIARPFMSKLRELANESVNLAIWDESKTVYTDIVTSNHSLQVSPGIESDASLYNTGAGKIMLASMNDKDLDKFLANAVLRRDTPNTITDVNMLKKHLLIIRQDGVAFDDEERELGVGNVAAPIKNASGIVVGALGILGPTVRLNRERMMALAPLVKDYALEISRAIGYKGQ
jgi:DNA-binding IclR family transcriptional regulator